MAITKETEIGKMEVVTEYKHIQVRTDTVIKEDGKELSRTFHRHVIKPDISDENLYIFEIYILYSFFVQNFSIF